MQDNQLKNMTIEQKKQNHITKVLRNVKSVDDDARFIHADEEEDELVRICEQIDLLKTTLESEGIDLSRIPDIGNIPKKKDAMHVLKILQIKNDNLRYCSFFEEGVLSVSYGLENIFNGQNEWFGSKIDLVGWPETVKIKIRRMRYDTSSFVSSVMKDYQISHGWRILFELLPSLFLYSRDRRLKNGDTLVQDNEYKNAVNDMSNV